LGERVITPRLSYPTTAARSGKAKKTTAREKRCPWLIRYRTTINSKPIDDGVGPQQPRATTFAVWRAYAIAHY